MPEYPGKALAQGSVVVLPTDTVYGLACAAGDFQAVEKMYGLKNRLAKPGTVIAADIDQLTALGLKARYLKPVEHLWPNPISVVVPSEPSLRYLDLGKGTLAVRVVDGRDLKQALRATGPLLTTSANPSGKKPAATIDEAKKYFAGQVDQYFNGGDLSGRLPSTIVRVIDDAVEVIRRGAVKINEQGEIES